MGIAFSPAKVSPGSGWGGDRAVVGIWSGRWFRVPEALQAQKTKYKQEEGDPGAAPGNAVGDNAYVSCLSQLFPLFPETSTTGSVAGGCCLDVCCVYGS